MARIQASDVEDILDTSLTTSQLEAFIDSAHRIVADHLTGQNIASDTLDEIEMWLAAHLASMRDQRVSNETVGDSSFTFQGDTDMGFDATIYGQQAKRLDPSNTLARLDDDTKQATFDVAGPTG